MWQKYLLYLVRWQLSTPILAGVIFLLTNHMNALWITVIANFIGGLIFFWVDKFIFRVKSKYPLWEIKDDTVCYTCGKLGRCYRIVEWRGYNRRVVKNPQFRCETCKEQKMAEIASKI